MNIIVKNVLKTKKNALKSSKCSKNAFKVNFINKCKKKDYFKIINITQNTFYTFKTTFQNTKKDASASKIPALKIITKS